MKSFILAVIAVSSLGVGIASAATTHPSQPQSSAAPQTLPHRPNYYNWMEGGGG